METFRSRVVLLVQKSRKAVRLYSAMESGNHSPFSYANNILTPIEQVQESREVQAEQWRLVTSELLQELIHAVENPNTKRLSHDIFSLRDRFYSHWRLSETELHEGQADLIKTAEQGDFIKAKTVAEKLISVKARSQASQAAYHELQELLTKAKVSENKSMPFSQHQEEPVILDNPEFKNVIPLRKRRVLGG